MSIFPNVPAVPGVPALLRQAGVFLPAPVLLVADAIAAIFGLSSAQWGVFQDGLPVVLADNVERVGIRKAYEISSYQVEPNAFESYNKVETPLESTIRFSAGGTDANRANLLSSIAALVDSLDLYDIVMPERVYESVNLVGYDVQRTAYSGVGLLHVDVRIVEVRVTAQTSYTNSKQPWGQAQQNNGAVQAQPYGGPDPGPVQ